MESVSCASHKMALIAYIDTPFGMFLADSLSAAGYEVMAIVSPLGVQVSGVFPIKTDRQNKGITWLDFTKKKGCKCFDSANIEGICEAIMEADVLVFELLEELVEESANIALHAFRVALNLCLSANNTETRTQKKFVLISTIMTLRETLPLCGETYSLTPISEQELERRIPHQKYLSWYYLEKLVAAYSAEGCLHDNVRVTQHENNDIQESTNEDALHFQNCRGFSTYVVCSGLQYGGGERHLAPFFFNAFDLCPKGLPIFGTGLQSIPAVHSRDLSTLVVKLLQKEGRIDSERNRSSPYILAVDDACLLAPSHIGHLNVSSSVTHNASCWYEIMKSLSLELGNGNVMEVRPAELPFFEYLELFTTDLVLSNEIMTSLIEPGEWIAQNGFSKNISLICKEFLEFRGLANPPHILIEGPPLSGKTFTARFIAKCFAIPHITLDDCTTSFYALFEELQKEETRLSLIVSKNVDRDSRPVDKKHNLTVSVDVDETEAKRKQIVEKNDILGRCRRVLLNEKIVEMQRATRGCNTAEILEKGALFGESDINNISAKYLTVSTNGNLLLNNADEINKSNYFPINTSKNEVFTFNPKREKLIVQAIEEKDAARLAEIQHELSCIKTVLYPSKNDNEDVNTKAKGKEQTVSKVTKASAQIQSEITTQKELTLKDLSDDQIQFIVRWRLTRADCRNHGFILDGFPTTAKEAHILFENNSVHRGHESAYPRSGSCQKEYAEVDKTAFEDSLLDSKLNLLTHCSTFPESVFPNLIISLRCSDEFLLSRLASVSTEGLHSTPEHFVTRLEMWKEHNYEDEKCYGTADEHSEHLVESLRGCLSALQLESGLKPVIKIFQVDKCFLSNVDFNLIPTSLLRHTVLPSPDVVLNEILEFVLTHSSHVAKLTKKPFIVQKSEEKLLLELEKAAVELDDHSNKFARLLPDSFLPCVDDQAALSVQAEEEEAMKRNEKREIAVWEAPLKRRLMKTVVPMLVKGFLDVCNERPINPVDSLAEWIQRHDPDFDDTFA